MLAGAWFGPTVTALNGLVFGDEWGWAQATISGCIYGTGMALLGVWQGRRAGTLSGRAAVGRAIAAGALPPNADPGTWEGALVRERDQLARDRWFFPVLAAQAVALVSALALTTGPDDWSVWLYVALAGAAGVLASLRAGRRLLVVRRLQEELDADGHGLHDRLTDIAVVRER